MKKILLPVVALIIASSCTPKHWVLSEAKTSKISIDSTTEMAADQRMAAYIAPLKKNIDTEMQQVIGQSAVEMRSGKPESLLSNWNADVYRLAAAEYLNEPVDMAVVNLGGLRAPIPKGDVTVGDVFRLMPFENELVVLWLKGSEVQKLLDIFAAEGGQGVSGITMEIKDRKAANARIQGKPIDPDKNYILATNDFLAGGNDQMIPLATPEKRLNTGLKIRNILMEYIIRENQNGRQINAALDGRIRK